MQENKQNKLLAQTTIPVSLLNEQCSLFIAATTRNAAGFDCKRDTLNYHDVLTALRYDSEADFLRTQQQNVPFEHRSSNFVISRRISSAKPRHFELISL